jgi:DNA mismatch endonuclease (patch repair protein)
MMSAIRGKNTSPELSVRKALHARGFRFRIHAKHLAGKPDLILPKYNAAIFIHGCFWHGHNCRFFKLPKTRTEFWLEKIGKNQARDRVCESILVNEGWRVLVVWECAVRLMEKEPACMLAEFIDVWLRKGDVRCSQVDEEVLQHRQK